MQIHRSRRRRRLQNEKQLWYSICRSFLCLLHERCAWCREKKKIVSIEINNNKIDCATSKGPISDRFRAIQIATFHCSACGVDHKHTQYTHMCDVCGLWPWRVSVYARAMRVYSECGNNLSEINISAFYYNMMCSDDMNGCTRHEQRTKFGYRRRRQPYIFWQTYHLASSVLFIHLCRQ